MLCSTVLMYNVASFPGLVRNARHIKEILAAKGNKWGLFVATLKTFFGLFVCLFVVLCVVCFVTYQIASALVIASL